MRFDKDYERFKRIFFEVLSRWYIFVSVLFITTGVAYLYVRYKSKIYRSSCTILIRDKDNRKVGAENLIEGLQLFSTAENIENQIGIIKSYSLIKKTLLDLDLNMNYYAIGEVKVSEIYRKVPVEVKFDSLISQALEVPFTIQIIDSQRYKLSVEATQYKSYDLITHKELEKTWRMPPFNQVCYFDSVVTTDFFSFSVSLTGIDHQKLYNTDQYMFMLRDIDKLTREFQQKLTVSPIEKWSSVIQLSMDSHIPEKVIDFLNQLSSNYLEQDVREKNEIAVNTMKFIDEQLINVTKDLFATETNLEGYKVENSFLNLEATSQKLLEDVTSLQQERAKLILQKKYYDYLLDYINNNKATVNIMAPSVSGVENELLIQKVDELNALISKKATLSFGVKKDNPSIALINLEIENLKKVIVENIKNIGKVADIKQEDLEQRIEALHIAIRRLPKNERELINMQRSFNLNNNLYNYLLEKKAEAGIAKAANKSDHKILDQARLEKYVPVSPNAKIVYIASFVFGLTSSYLIVLLINIFDNKVRSANQILERTDVPLIGIIGKSDEDYLPILNQPKSMIAESFRSLRVNLQYTETRVNDQIRCTLIGVTSTISGEGKSFCASNLAISLSMTNMKVLLIDADLRKPSLSKKFKLDVKAGLSAYLVGKIDYDELICKSVNKNLSIVCAGYVPPNPSEILESERLDELIEMASKEFDIIIFDTPPIGIVSDYIVISEKVDKHLFVMRSNYSHLDSIRFVNELKAEESYKNLYIVLNDNSDGGFGYKGYKYGGEYVYE